MIDSLADAGWLAEIGALDGPSARATAPDAADVSTATLFTDDPGAVRTPIGARADAVTTGDVAEIAARVLAHVGR